MIQITNYSKSRPDWLLELIPNLESVIDNATNDSRCLFSCYYFMMQYTYEQRHLIRELAVTHSITLHDNVLLLSKGDNVILKLESINHGK